MVGVEARATERRLNPSSEWLNSRATCQQSEASNQATEVTLQVLSRQFFPSLDVADGRQPLACNRPGRDGVTGMPAKSDAILKSTRS